MYENPCRVAGPGSRIFFVVLMVLSLLAVSCQKDEGPGGTGSISGRILEQFYNEDFSLVLHSQPAIDEEVFIVYGTDETPGDRVLTGPTGGFRFDYLYPGQYYVYYRSLDSSSTGIDDDWMVSRVDLERGEDLDLGTLEKSNILEFDEGRGVISGVVIKTKYVQESKWPNLVVEYVDFAHEHEVYLTYGDHDFYDVRVRTQDDGYFEFDGLIPGNYTIFLYSEDVTRVTEHVVLRFEVKLQDMDARHDLGEINIEAI